MSLHGCDVCSDSVDMLETLVDAHGMSAVVGALETIAETKAERLVTDRATEDAARRWWRFSGALHAMGAAFERLEAA